MGFSEHHGDKLLAHFRRVEKAIEGADRFVTYSEKVKWATLVERYHIDPSRVTVVPHGVMRLDDRVTVTGFTDNNKASRNLCRSLFDGALAKAVGYPPASLSAGGEIRFLFYASQFRPNKNLGTFLKAYEFLLRRRFLGLKLVLTGDPEKDPVVAKFVKERALENDVLFLKGLTNNELAACYRLADLAVNPSLSEGGCPFTLTEALSLGTPVVMARVPVTEEVVIEPVLRDRMLFDPYDWEDVAARIEWGVKNREELLLFQRPLFERLSQRTWDKVVGEYVELLDSLVVGENHGR